MDERKHGTAKSEAAEIKRMGARPQANSGRGKINKGDAIIDEHWLCDIKEYPKGYTVSLDNWAKICTDAIRAGNYEPTLNIVVGTGTQRIRLFVISEDEMNDFRRLRQEELKRIIGDNNE
jgi:hypothetical protein